MSEVLKSDQLRDLLGCSRDADVSSAHPPCNECGGPHQFDTSLPSEQWNRVIRAQGLGDYLCTNCILKAFALQGESFAATLWSDNFSGLKVEFRISK